MRMFGSVELLINDLGSLTFSCHFPHPTQFMGSLVHFLLGCVGMFLFLRGFRTKQLTIRGAEPTAGKSVLYKMDGSKNGYSCCSEEQMFYVS